MCSECLCATEKLDPAPGAWRDIKGLLLMLAYDQPGFILSTMFPTASPLCNWIQPWKPQVPPGCSGVLG